MPSASHQRIINGYRRVLITHRGQKIVKIVSEELVYSPGYVYRVLRLNGIDVKKV